MRCYTYNTSCFHCTDTSVFIVLMINNFWIFSNRWRKDTCYLGALLSLHRKIYCHIIWFRAKNLDFPIATMYIRCTPVLYIVFKQIGSLEYGAHRSMNLGLEYVRKFSVIQRLSVVRIAETNCTRVSRDNDKGIICTIEHTIVYLTSYMHTYQYEYFLLPCIVVIAHYLFVMKVVVIIMMCAPYKSMNKQSLYISLIISQIKVSKGLLNKGRQE